MGKTKVVRISAEYADIASEHAKTLSPKVSQTALLNHQLKVSGIEGLIKKEKKVKK